MTLQASWMSSSDSSGVRTWRPQNDHYPELGSNWQTSSDPEWSPRPRPISRSSPAFQQQRYGPSSRQPSGRGNQYSGSASRQKSGSTSRNLEYHDIPSAVERELFNKPDRGQAAWNARTCILENVGAPISAPRKTRSRPQSSRWW